MKRVTPFPKPWKSPISYDAKTTAKLLREAMDKLGWEYTRDESEKLYDKMMVIVPLMKVAHVYRFRVDSPISLTIDTYDTHPTHSSLIPWLLMENLEEKDVPVVKKLLDEMVSSVERPPWIFTLGQRVNHGALMPEFKKSKLAWQLLGYDSFAKYVAPKKEKVSKK